MKKVTKQDCLTRMRNQKLIDLVKAEVNYEFLRKQKAENISQRSQMLSQIDMKIEKGKEYLEVIDKLLDERSWNTQKNSEGEGEAKKKGVGKKS